MSKCRLQRFSVAAVIVCALAADATAEPSPPATTAADRRVEIAERLGFSDTSQWIKAEVLPIADHATEGGDLLATRDDQGQCTLWFCVRGATGTEPARWTQVVLGPAFDGRG